MPLKNERKGNLTCSHCSKKTTARRWCFGAAQNVCGNCGNVYCWECRHKSESILVTTPYQGGGVYCCSKACKAAVVKDQCEKLEEYDECLRIARRNQARSDAHNARGRDVCPRN